MVDNWSYNIYIYSWLGNTLKKNIINKYELIITNIPFGKYSYKMVIKWKELNCLIKSNKMTALFIQKTLQKTIKMVKPGG